MAGGGGALGGGKFMGIDVVIWGSFVSGKMLF